MSSISRTSVIGTALGLVGLLGAGCGPRDASSPPILGPVTVESSHVHIVGTSESIVSMVDIMPMDDDSVWILNNAEPFLVHLAANGSELDAQGLQGEGPGEFSWPSTLVRDEAAGEVRVLDSTHGRLLSVEEEAGGRATLDLPRDSGGVVRLNSYEWLWLNNGGRFWIEAFEGGLVWARPAFSSPWIQSFWSTDVVRLRRDGELEELVATSDVVGDPTELYPRAQWLLPFPIWTGCPDGSLALYDPSTNLVRRFTSAGDSLATHPLPPERRIEVTTERIFEAVYPGVLRNRLMGDPPERDVFYQAIERNYEDRETEFADVFPEYAHADCAFPNTVWVQQFDSSRGEMGRGTTWIRIAEDGQQGKVEFPDTFRPMRFRNGRIWGVHRGDFGIDHVAWVEVPSI